MHPDDFIEARTAEILREGRNAYASMINRAFDWLDDPANEVTDPF